MLLPPIWRGRRTHVPVRNRIAQFRAVVRAAQSVSGYRDRLKNAGLDSHQRIQETRDIEQALSTLAPIPAAQYRGLFAQRAPVWRRVPQGMETRSALLLPYAAVRTGLQDCRVTAEDRFDPYSPVALDAASRDLYNLSQALLTPATAESFADHALAVFCGIDAGLLTERETERLWESYQVPLFQQFLGTDGLVVAAECEVHAGLHIRREMAIVERLNGQLVITSLTDEQHPALRVESGFHAEIDKDPCECGRLEPRIVGLRPSAQGIVAAVAA